MRKLAPVIIIITIMALISGVILQAAGVSFDFLSIGRYICVAAGWSMTVVGIIVILFVAFLTGDKNKIYQGTYCALLGIAISNFSLIALIASVTLIGWLDYRGKSLE